MKIAVVGIIDGARSGRHLSRALKKHTAHQVAYANYKGHTRDYARAIVGADVIIVAGDALAYVKNGLIYMYAHNCRKIYPKGSKHKVKRNAVLISMPLGCNYRRKSSGFKAFEIWPLTEYSRNFDMVTPAEPDLNYPDINHGVLPYAIDTDKVTYGYSPGKKIVVGAYMGGKDSKNVRAYLMPALKQLEREGIDVKLMLGGLKHMVPHSQYMEQMKRYTVYYGQITPIGVHGRSEVEAIAMGIPTICGITAEAVSRAGENKEYGAPFIKAYNAKDVADVLRKIHNNELDLKAISKASRSYAVKWHSYQSVARQALNIIEQAKARKAKRK